MKRIGISIVLLACQMASAAAQSASVVLAYWTDYNVTINNWDYYAAPVACASVDGDKPLDWRKQYGWAGYCGSPDIQELCGRCLSLTNIETGAKETVRIVDSCGTGGLDLDLETAFKPLDTNGNGIAQGHLIVDYEFVDCENSTGPGETNVTAYWTDYNVTNTNWDYNAAHVACAAVDGDKPWEWRSKYGWTAFCGNAGDYHGLDACGMCLKVTNRETEDEEIVRIVDTCGSGGLDLDLESAFKPIDTNGNGIILGHLMVDYEFVNCGDSSTENKVLVYSQYTKD